MANVNPTPKPKLTKKELFQQALSDAKKVYDSNIANIKKKYRILLAIEQATGLDLITTRYSCDSYNYNITRADLPKLRKVVGRLTVSNKRPTQNYDETKLIEVTVTPQNRHDWGHIQFVYTKEWEPDVSSKCKVKTITTTRQSIVCEKPKMPTNTELMA